MDGFAMADFVTTNLTSLAGEASEMVTAGAPIIGGVIVALLGVNIGINLLKRFGGKIG